MMTCDASVYRPSAAGAYGYDEWDGALISGEMASACAYDAAACSFSSPCNTTVTVVNVALNGVASWPSRDPIAENGGVNLYGFVQNDPNGGLDPNGLVCCVEKFSIVRHAPVYFQRTTGRGLFRRTEYRWGMYVWFHLVLTMGSDPEDCLIRQYRTGWTEAMYDRPGWRWGQVSRRTTFSRTLDARPGRAGWWHGNWGWAGGFGLNPSGRWNRPSWNMAQKVAYFYDTPGRPNWHRLDGTGGQGSGVSYRGEYPVKANITFETEVVDITDYRAWYLRGRIKWKVSWDVPSPPQRPGTGGCTIKFTEVTK